MRKSKKAVKEVSQVGDVKTECPRVGNCETKPKPVKWVYIMFPNGQIYKVAASKIVENYQTAMSIKGETADDMATNPDAIVAWVKNRMLWHEISDSVIMVYRDYHLEPKVMFECSFITAKSSDVGVVEE